MVLYIKWILVKSEFWSRLFWSSHRQTDSQCTFVLDSWWRTRWSWLRQDDSAKYALARLSVWLYSPRHCYENWHLGDCRVKSPLGPHRTWPAHIFVISRISVVIKLCVFLVVKSIYLPIITSRQYWRWDVSHPGIWSLKRPQNTCNPRISMKRYKINEVKTAPHEYFMNQHDRFSQVDIVSLSVCQIFG